MITLEGAPCKRGDNLRKRSAVDKLGFEQITER